MPIDIQRVTKARTLDDLAQATSDSLANLEAQVNGKPELHVNDTDTIPQGAKDIDFLATLNPKENIMRLSIPQGKGKRRTLKIEDLGGPYPPVTNANFKGLTTSVAPPSVVEYPNPGDYGIHNNTTAPGFFYLAFNNAGVIEYNDLFADGTFHGTNFKGFTTSALAPALAQYPNDKDWGVHRNSAGGGVQEMYFVYNRAGTVHIIPMDMPVNPFNNTNFLGHVNTAVAPVLADFPNVNDWGFHINTATAALNLCYNHAGTLKIRSLV